MCSRHNSRAPDIAPSLLPLSLGQALLRVARPGCSRESEAGSGTLTTRTLGRQEWTLDGILQREKNGSMILRLWEVPGHWEVR